MNVIKGALVHNTDSFVNWSIKAEDRAVDLFSLKAVPTAYDDIDRLVASVNVRINLSIQTMYRSLRVNYQRSAMMAAFWTVVYTGRVIAREYRENKAGAA